MNKSKISWISSLFALSVLISVGVYILVSIESARAATVILKTVEMIDQPDGPIVGSPVEAQISPAVRDLLAETVDQSGDNPPRHNPLAAEDDGGQRGTWNRTAVPLDPLVSRKPDLTGRTPGLDFDFAGTGNPTGCGTCSPPDTNGDVGPNHYIQIVNATKVAIYDKTGTLVSGPFNLGTLWSSGSCTSNLGDPIALYDPLADRWLLSQFNNPSIMCVAISQTSDPTGAYFLYNFSVGSFPDYFKFGVWPDGYYMAANEATYTAYAFDRASMLLGNAATFQKFTGGTNFLLPSDLDGPTPPPVGAPNHFYTFKDDSFHGGVDRLEVWDFHVDWVTPANSTFTLVDSLPIAAFTYTVCGFFNFDCIPQLGTAQKVDAVSEWPMHRFPYRNFGSHESLVGNFTAGGGLGDAGAAIRWFELRKTGTNWVLFQEGTLDPGDGHDRFMGSIAMDGDGNIALGYSVSSSTMNPAIRYASRLATDPPGTLQAEASLIAGGGSQTNSDRWGDYSAMGIDPASDCSFWYTNEYYPANSPNQWQTRIGVFTLPECGGGGGGSGTLAGSVTSANTSAGLSGALVEADDGSAVYSTTTDSLGDYIQLLPVGTYTMTASATGYITETVGGVEILTDTTTTQDFALTAGYLEYSPALIEATLLPNSVATHTLTISNSGTAPLTFSLSDMETGFSPRIQTRPAPGGDLSRQSPLVQNQFPSVSRAPVTDVIQDGGFEAGTPNPFWTEFSTNFGTPLCDASCGFGGGSGPHSGSWWAWFGGIGAYEEGMLSQDVILAPGTATLTFYLEIPVCASAADYLEVNIDGNQVYFVDGSSPLCGNFGYQLQTVDLTPYANGGQHTLEFHSEIFGPDITNFFVDDVALDSVGNPLDAPWVSENPPTGSIAAGGMMLVDVIFDSSVVTATGNYTAELDFAGNFENIVPPGILVMHVTASIPGVDLSSDQSAGGALGGQVDYTFTVTNTGTITDSFDLSLSGGTWTSVLSISSTANLAPGESETFTLTVYIPAGAGIGTSDTVTVIATSTIDPGVSDSAMATTTASEQRIYLPIINKS